MIGLLAVRTDFGFGNPNLAGALFAMLAVGVWVFGCKGLHPSTRFWICLAASACFAGLMVMTASRGAVVALVAGLLAVWWTAGRPRAKGWQMVGLAGVALLLGIFAGSSRMGSRVAGSSAEEGSITSRLAIFQEVPAMLAAAPAGWGAGQSADAYQNWFQAPEDARTYKHLLSTHATWLVERGWGFRFAYILGWVLVVMVCWKTPGALGAWVAFGVAGIFSHVGGDWRLWVVPGLALGFAAWASARMMRWPECRSWRNALAVALSLTVLLYISGQAVNRGIFSGRGFVKVGSGMPGKWFFAPDRSVLGAAYGKVVRKEKSAGVAWEIAPIVNAAPREIVLSGRATIPAGGAFVQPYELLWLNPPAKLNEAQRGVVEQAAKKTMVWGELRTDANPRELKSWFETLPDGRWVFVKGTALFLGEWESESLF